MPKCIPLRTCIGCGKTLPKDNLLRFGEERGFYLCVKSETCFNLAMKKNSFARAMKRKITNDEIEQIRQKYTASSA